jgi:hypothetical protein
MIFFVKMSTTSCIYLLLCPGYHYAGVQWDVEHVVGNFKDISYQTSTFTFSFTWMVSNQNEKKREKSKSLLLRSIYDYNPFLCELLLSNIWRKYSMKGKYRFSSQFFRVHISYTQLITEAKSSYNIRFRRYML